MEGRGHNATFHCFSREKSHVPPFVLNVSSSFLHELFIYPVPFLLLLLNFLTAPKRSLPVLTWKLNRPCYGVGSYSQYLNMIPLPQDFFLRPMLTYMSAEGPKSLPVFIGDLMCMSSRLHHTPSANTTSRLIRHPIVSIKSAARPFCERLGFYYGGSSTTRLGPAIIAPSSLPLRLCAEDTPPIARL
jgi:hypothetical protein